jgi:hypothetical protein
LACNKQHTPNPILLRPFIALQVLLVTVAGYIGYRRHRQQSAELQCVMLTLEEFVPPVADEWEVDPSLITLLVRCSV